MSKIAKILICIAIIAIAIYFSFVFDFFRKDSGVTFSNESNSNTIDMIRVSSPSSFSVIISPITISGEARGSWFFEATFPVRVIGSDGSIIGTGFGRANGDWMTTNFVPWTATINFDKGLNATGTLRFLRDNPSGDPFRDMHFDLPISFATSSIISK